MQVAHRQWSVTPSPDLPVEIGVTPDCFCGADYRRSTTRQAHGGVRRKQPQGDWRRAPRLSPSQPQMISTAFALSSASACRRLSAVFGRRRHLRKHRRAAQRLTCLAPPHRKQTPVHPVAALPRRRSHPDIRIRTLGNNPCLLLGAPIAPSPLAGDYLDTPISVGIMPVSIHGICSLC